MKLLIVDSDKDMVEMLTGLLKTYGYEVHRAYSGERAKQEWAKYEPDLVIMDTALPDVDALAMCQDLRRSHDALVLVLEAKGDVQAEVRCLDAGADGYLRKPFFPLQLLAHIRAVSRRVRSTLKAAPSSVVTVGALRVDHLRNEAFIRGKTVRLTPTESKLLHLLALNADGVCTADQIVTHVWNYGEYGDTTLIKAHIRHLREKIEPMPSAPRYIKTVLGVGYMLVRHVEDAETPAAAVVEERVQPALIGAGHRALPAFAGRPALAQ